MFDKVIKPKKRFARSLTSALLVSSILAGSATAQVSGQTPYYTDPFTGAQQGQATTGAPSLPQASLVQRDYRTTPTATQQRPTVQQNSDVLYIDPSNTAPANIADGLSDYNAGRLNRTADQLRGDYGEFSREQKPTGNIQEAWNNPLETKSPGQIAPGIVRFEWTHNLIMQVQVGEATGSSIVFPDWEVIENVMLGDDETVEAQITRPNVLDVRTLQIGRDAAITVIGESGNMYKFYVRSVGRNAKKLSDLQVFVELSISKSSSGWFRDQAQSKFSRTGGGAESDNPALSNVQHDASDAHPQSVSNGSEVVPKDRARFEHRMFEVNKGDKEIAPEYVMHDGRFTYLSFPPGMTDKPAVFRMVDGVEGRVNTRTVGRFGEVVVVEAMGDFVLRSGSRIVCIVFEPKTQPKKN